MEGQAVQARSFKPPSAVADLKHGRMNCAPTSASVPVNNGTCEAGFNAERISGGSLKNAGLKPSTYKSGEEASRGVPKYKNAPTRVGA